MAELESLDNLRYNGAAEGAGNKFQHAIGAWRSKEAKAPPVLVEKAYEAHRSTVGIGFTALVSSLDSTANEIVGHQKDSTIQRKELAQKTKEFRKLDDAAKLSEIKGLLKSYQSFIDTLTNHSKSITSAFLQTYTKLSEAPDPYPLLEASVDSMLMSEDTMPKITSENERLQKSIAKLTSQLEESETRLAAEMAARKTLEKELESKVKSVEQSWSALVDERKSNWEAKEKALELKVTNQDKLIKELKVNQEVSKKLDRGDIASRGAASSAELDMLTSQLERTNNRLVEVEARNEKLSLELARAKSNLHSVPSRPLEEDPGYLRIQTECASLLRKLEAVRVEKDGLQRDLDARLRSLEREAALLKDERNTLQSKLSQWSDYNEVKQELEILKSIEFATGDDDVDRNVDTSTGAKEKGDTLEKMLLSRNKKLNDDLTVLRVSHQQLQAKLHDLQEEMSRTNAELEKMQNLNHKLEDQMSSLQSGASNAFHSGHSVTGTFARGYAPSVHGRSTAAAGRTSPTSSIISGLDPRSTERDTGASAGILPMITAQRDRFKKRNAQLEQELSASNKTVSQLRHEIAALQQDNLNLYEKTRYVSTYNRGGHSTATTSGSSTNAAARAYPDNPNPSSINMGESPGISLDRYRKAYESNLSPFAAFRGRESSRAYRRMSLPERAVYSVLRVVLASRMSRNLFAAYCLALHLLVFMCLYWLNGASSGQCGKVAALGASAIGAAAAAGEKGRNAAAAVAGAKINDIAGKKVVPVHD